MPRAWAEPQLMRMLDTLRHESFYVTGTFIDESLGLYIGWAARKDSFSDGMPIRNEHGDVVIVFAGEDYPEPGTAPDLKTRGHDCELHGIHLVDLLRRYELQLDVKLLPQES